MSAITLYPQQLELKNNIYNEWNKGNNNVLAVKPTGGGKSIVVSDIVLDGYNVNLKQSVIAHRNELVSQMAMHVAKRGIMHRVIGSDQTIRMITRQQRAVFGRSFVNPSSNTAVVGVDTLISRQDELSRWTAQNDRWFIDEAHHVLQANKWGKAVTMYPNALGAGFTATPERADGQGLGADYDGVFHVMVQSPNMRWHIDNGYLSEYEIVCPESDLELHEEEVAKSGDWSSQKLRAAAKKSHIVGDVVTAYCRYAYMKQAICFATDVETAGEIASNFNDNGIRAAALSAKTPFNVREKFIQEFKDGKLKVLVNVDLFDEGFDVPACEVVIMARPTASLGKYMQMFGRCMRTAPGKLYGLVIDHVSNVIRHGLPDKPREWTLARRDKRAKQQKDPDEIELRACLNKECTKVYEKFRPVCPYCGFAPPLPEPRERSIEMVEGDLVLLDRAKLEEMRRAVELEAPGDLGSRIMGGKVGQKIINDRIEKCGAQKELIDAIDQWAGVQRFKGFSDSEIYRKFYLTTGFDVMSALDGGRKIQEFKQLTEKVKGWYT